LKDLEKTKSWLRKQTHQAVKGEEDPSLTFLENGGYEVNLLSHKVLNESRQIHPENQFEQ
jgi:hypothetical protein